MSSTPSGMGLWRNTSSPMGSGKKANVASRPGKPCPTCYLPMTQVSPNHWVCAKHGPPTKP
jgi:hypothetical protein